MSVPWSNKTEKTDPIVANDEFMILDSEDATPETKNKRVRKSTVQSTLTTDVNNNGFNQTSIGNLEFQDTSVAPAGNIPSIYHTPGILTLNIPTGEQFEIFLNGMQRYSFGDVIDFHDELLVNADFSTGIKSSSPIEWIDNIRQTFGPGPSNSGLNVGERPNDPNAPVNGDIYYNGVTDKFKVFENNSWIDMVGASQTPWLSNIDGATFSLTNVTTIGLRDTGDTVTFRPSSGQTGNFDMQIPNLDDNAEIIFDNQSQSINNKLSIGLENQFLNIYSTNFTTTGEDETDVAKLQFLANDDEDNTVEFANMIVNTVIVSEGDEYAKITFNMMSGGSLIDALVLDMDDGDMILTDLGLNMGSNGISNCNEVVFVGNNTHIVADTNTTLQLVCNEVTDNIVMRYSVTDRHVFSELSAEMQGDLQLKTDNTTSILTMEANHTTPVDDAVISQIDFYDNDNLIARRLFAQIETTTVDVTNTSIDGGIIFRVAQNNTLVDAIKINVLTQTIETIFTIQGSNTISTSGSMDCQDMEILDSLLIGENGTTAGFLTLDTDADTTPGTLVFISIDDNLTNMVAAEQSEGDLTVTIPDLTEDDIMALLSETQTLLNKTLTTPTIVATGFANMNHTHQDAATGGTLVATLALTATGTKDSTTFLRGDNTWAVPTLSLLLSDIDADGFDLKDISNIEFSNTTLAPAGTIPSIFLDSGIFNFNVPNSSEFSFTSNNVELMSLNQINGLQLNKRIQNFRGSDVTTTANITLGDGNIFSIVGIGTVDLIDSTNWQNGSVINLIVANTVTFTHDSIPSGSFSNMLLAGEVDFVATLGSILTLVFFQNDWVEVSRAVR